MRALLALGAVAAAALAPGAVSGQSPPGPPAGTSAPNGTIDGEQLFATLCGFCHQGGGRAAGKGPKLAGTDQTDAQIVNRIKTGKPGEMPAFGRAFSDEQIRAIVAYIRSLTDTGR